MPVYIYQVNIVLMETCSFAIEQDLEFKPMVSISSVVGGKETNSKVGSGHMGLSKRRAAAKRAVLVVVKYK